MKSKPNIIYILADDMGYGDISYYNEKCPFKTNNLDALCESGIRFTDAHATSSVCTPSRYGIVTGRYNWRSKLKKGVLNGYSSTLIEKETTTVAQMLQSQGYQTACIGKWHLGMEYTKSQENEGLDHIDFEKEIKDGPNKKGFDYFYGIAASLDMPPYVYIENDHFTEKPTRITKGLDEPGGGFWREGPTGEHFNHEEVLDNLCNHVLNKIVEYKENPFFIYFPMTAPHTPILPTIQFQGKSKTLAYGDFVLQCDDVVGRIMDRVKELHLEDDTIIIFASDNGCSPNADIEGLKKFGYFPNYIFRGNKADIYEGGHRIPLVVQWKDYIKPNTVCNETVCLSDFYATIAEILGYRLKDHEAVDSISNLKLWFGHEESIRDITIHQSCDGSLAIRKGKWKLEMCPGCGGWKPVKDKEDYTNCPKFQLYNLEDDVTESKNVVLEYPEIYKELRATLVGIIINGRSTPGKKQENNGEVIWETVKWLENDL